MASITLKYNARNRVAQKTLDYILSLGVFEATPDVDRRVGLGADLTRKTIEAVERGEVVTCKSYDEYLKLTGGHA